MLDIDVWLPYLISQDSNVLPCNQNLTQTWEHSWMFLRLNHLFYSTLLRILQCSPVQSESDTDMGTLSRSTDSITYFGFKWSASCWYCGNIEISMIMPLRCSILYFSRCHHRIWSPQHPFAFIWWFCDTHNSNPVSLRLVASCTTTPR